MEIKYLHPSAEDFKTYNDCGFDGEKMLAGKMKIIVTDDNGNTGITYMEETEIEKLGHDYIESHVKLEYSELLLDWRVEISQNDWHNDTTRNPHKEIPVKFIEWKYGENTQVWQNAETGKYYLRMLEYHETFAYWITCGGRQTGWIDNSCIRPNITFVNVENGQKESTFYDDWNGTAAYSKTFNPEFYK